MDEAVGPAVGSIEASRTQKDDKAASCGGCGRSEDEVELHTCANCRQKLYCSSECQLQDWKQHRRECKELQRAEEAKAMPAGAPSGDQAKAPAIVSGDKPEEVVLRYAANVGLEDAVWLWRDRTGREYGPHSLGNLHCWLLAGHLHPCTLLWHPQQRGTGIALGAALTAHPATTARPAQPGAAGGVGPAGGVTLPSTAEAAGGDTAFTQPAQVQAHPTQPRQMQAAPTQPAQAQPPPTQPAQAQPAPREPSAVQPLQPAQPQSAPTQPALDTGPLPPAATQAHALAEPHMSTAAAAVARHPKHPQKAQPASAGAAAPQGQPPAKRGRGRPRKNKPAADAAASAKGLPAAAGSSQPAAGDPAAPAQLRMRPAVAGSPQGTAEVAESAAAVPASGHNPTGPGGLTRRGGAAFLAGEAPALPSRGAPIAAGALPTADVRPPQTGTPTGDNPSNPAAAEPQAPAAEPAKLPPASASPVQPPLQPKGPMLPARNSAAESDVPERAATAAVPGGDAAGAVPVPGGGSSPPRPGCTRPRGSRKRRQDFTDWGVACLGPKAKSQPGKAAAAAENSPKRRTQQAGFIHPFAASGEGPVQAAPNSKQPAGPRHTAPFPTAPAAGVDARQAAPVPRATAQHEQPRRKQNAQGSAGAFESAAEALEMTRIPAVEAATSPEAEAAPAVPMEGPRDVLVEAVDALPAAAAAVAPVPEVGKKRGRKPKAVKEAEQRAAAAAAAAAAQQGAGVVEQAEAAVVARHGAGVLEQTIARQALVAEGQQQAVAAAAPPAEQPSGNPQAVDQQAGAAGGRAEEGLPAAKRPRGRPPKIRRFEALPGEAEPTAPQVLGGKLPQRKPGRPRGPARPSRAELALALTQQPTAVAASQQLTQQPTAVAASQQLTQQPTAVAASPQLTQQPALADAAAPVSGGVAAAGGQGEPRPSRPDPAAPSQVLPEMSAPADPEHDEVLERQESERLPAAAAPAGRAPLQSRGSGVAQLAKEPVLPALAQAQLQAAGETASHVLAARESPGLRASASAGTGSRDCPPPAARIGSAARENADPNATAGPGLFSRAGPAIGGAEAEGQDRASLCHAGELSPLDGAVPEGGLYQRERGQQRPCEPGEQEDACGDSVERRTRTANADTAAPAPPPPPRQQRQPASQDGAPLLRAGLARAPEAASPHAASSGHTGDLLRGGGRSAHAGDGRRAAPRERARGDRSAAGGVRRGEARLPATDGDGAADGDAGWDKDAQDPRRKLRTSNAPTRSAAAGPQEYGKRCIESQAWLGSPEGRRYEGRSSEGSDVDIGKDEDMGQPSGVPFNSRKAMGSEEEDAKQRPGPQHFASQSDRQRPSKEITAGPAGKRRREHYTDECEAGEGAGYRGFQGRSFEDEGPGNEYEEDGGQIGKQRKLTASEATIAAGTVMSQLEVLQGSLDQQSMIAMSAASSAVYQATQMVMKSGGRDMGAVRTMMASQRTLFALMRLLQTTGGTGLDKAFASDLALGPEAPAEEAGGKGEASSRHPSAHGHFRQQKTCKDGRLGSGGGRGDRPQKVAPAHDISGPACEPRVEPSHGHRGADPHQHPRVHHRP